MSTITPSQRRSTPFIETNVSAYDQLNGALISCIILVGFLVTVLFLLWVTSVYDFSKKAAVSLEYLEPFGNEKPEGFEDDVMEPGVEEFPEVETPQLKDALEAVTDAVSSIRANLEKGMATPRKWARGPDTDLEKADQVAETPTWSQNTSAGKLNMNPKTSVSTPDNWIFSKSRWVVLHSVPTISYS